MLSKFVLFGDLTAGQLCQIGSTMHHKAFPVGTTIFSMDQPSEVVYFLLAGTVKICLDERNGADVILGIYGSGEVLDVISVADGSSHYVTAVTLETSEL